MHVCGYCLVVHTDRGSQQKTRSSIPTSTPAQQRRSARTHRSTIPSPLAYLRILNLHHVTRTHSTQATAARLVKCIPVPVRGIFSGFDDETEVVKNRGDVALPAKRFHSLSRAERHSLRLVCGCLRQENNTPQEEISACIAMHSTCFCVAVTCVVGNFSGNT